MNRHKTLLISLAATVGLFVTACGDDGGKGGSSGDFCTLARAFESAQAGTDDIFNGDASSADVKKAFETVDKQINAMVNAAPAEIKKDTQTVQAGLRTFIDVMKSADYDLTKLFSDPTVADKLAVLDSDEFQKASENIDTYLNDTCGINTSS